MEPSLPLLQHTLARLDPKRVRRALGRAAPVMPEDLLAAIHVSLLERCAEIRFTPEQLLEVGRVPGPCAQALQSRHPKARVLSLGIAPPGASWTPRLRLPWKHHPLAVTGDPLRFPLPANHFDLALSNMMLHWSSDPLATLRELRRVLKPEAPLLLATLGESSLKELKQTLATLDQTRHGRVWHRVPAFPALPDLGDLLVAAGFSRPVVDRDLWQPRLPDGHTLLHEMRRIGATNPHRQRPPCLMGKGYLAEVNTLYSVNHGTEDGSIPVTLEILFGHAWKK
ncbi:MAG: methyltransferase domain-containing protein [Magnetococcales bacterium]|nr:methyltransferase domain-containing protein [Magnetococcales bacterium]